jgi:hypothetical protein
LPIALVLIRPAERRRFGARADIKIPGKRGNGFRARAAAVIGVPRQRAGDDGLFVSRICDDLFGEFGDSRAAM